MIFLMLVQSMRYGSEKTVAISPDENFLIFNSTWPLTCCKHMFFFFEVTIIVLHALRQRPGLEINVFPFQRNLSFKVAIDVILDI